MSVREGKKKMLNKLAELSVSKRADYGDTIVKSLEKSGFIVVKECDTLTDNHYVIAAADENCSDCGINTRGSKE